MSDSALFIEDLNQRCALAALVHADTDAVYAPTANQIFAFALIRALKLEKGASIAHVEGRPSHVALVRSTQAQIMDSIHQIAQHLHDWGMAVTQLQRKDERAWELMRFQMEKSVLSAARGYGCADREDLITEGLSAALLKVFELLGKAPVIADDESAEALAARINARAEDLRGVYDFHSPLYGWAKLIARNELISLLRREGRVQLLEPEQLEQAAGADTAAEATFHSVVAERRTQTEEDEAAETVAYEAARAKYAEVLTALVSVIDNLSAGQRRVICFTLMSRPQFQRALSITGVAPPAESPPFDTDRSDDAIGDAIHKTANTVRVQRSNAVRAVSRQSPPLGDFLKRLIER
ncbi:MAG: hypothetical protein KDD84_10850 [Caldilineaceae bacterium]|nr:hypothetical protein [Caldilineaceae bacterium]